VAVTDALRPGDNTLEIQVVNLWINRQIGDEQLAEDSERNRNGTLKSWPQWLTQGQPSPTGRYTFTSWRLWNRDDPLVESRPAGPGHATRGAGKRSPLTNVALLMWSGASQVPNQSLPPAKGSFSTTAARGSTATRRNMGTAAAKA
jgi:hypothetical protein